MLVFIEKWFIINKKNLQKERITYFNLITIVYTDYVIHDMTIKIEIFYKLYKLLK